jgi:hypothetical protein
VYFLNGHKKTQKVFDVDRKINHSLVIGEGFEDYNFYYNPEISFESAVDKHLKWLRDNYSYIRLWFSGGKDSRIILDSAIKNNIYIDEIASFESTVFPMIFGDRAEQVYGILPILKKYQPRLQQTKITYFYLDNDYFTWVYSNPEWHAHLNHWFFTAGRGPDTLFEYGLENPPLIDFPDQCLELFGFTEPSIWYDSTLKKWKFVYPHSRFNDILPNMQTISTGSGAGVLNAYLSELITKWESIDYYPEKFNEINGREQKSIIDLFKKTKMPPNYPNTPKKPSFAEKGEYPTDEKFWIAGTGGLWKDEAQTLMMRQMQHPPESFNLWAFETDWDAVIDQINKGGILSKEFTFEK